MKASAANYLMLFKTMEQGVVYQNTDGRIIEANPAAEQILGLTREQLLGLSSLDSVWRCQKADGSPFPGEEHPTMLALRTGQAVRNVPMGIYNPSEDRMRWVRITALPMFLPGETTAYEVYATITDETERRLAELEKSATEARYRALFNDMNEGVALHSLIYERGKAVDYRLTEVNRSFERILGIEAALVTGKLGSEIYGLAEAPYLEKYAGVAESGVPFTFETYYPPMNKYFYISVSPLGKDSFATIFLDISEQKNTAGELQLVHEQLQAQNEELRASNEELNSLYQQVAAAAEGLRHQYRELSESQRLLRDREERFRLALEAANDVLYDWDIRTHTVAWSEHWEARLGFSYATEGATDALLGDAVHPDDRAARNAALAAHLEGRAPYYSAEFRLRDIHGDYFWVMTRGKALRDEYGVPIRVLGSLTDITDARQRQEKIRYMAYYDALTGLPNRWLFNEQLEKLLAGGHEAGCCGAVMLLDVDNFKMINDSFGHAFGDRLLQEIGRHISRFAEPTGFVARLSADEFIVMLQDIDSATAAADYAGCLLSSFSRPFELDSQRVFVTLSIGIALFPQDGASAGELLRCSDIAMHEVKKQGKNGWSFFDDSMRQAVVCKLRLETELRAAVRNQEFLLYYQPIVSLPEGKIAGFEALLRWRNPERGLTLPAVFIPLAEETGLILAIGEWVLREACRCAVRLRQTYPMPLQIAVNISSRQMAQNNFVDSIIAILAETGLPAESLELEITESMLIDSFESTVQKLKQLRALGVKIALDDFGTGYSSLTYLKNLPIHKVKIDKSFVNDTADLQAQATILGAIVQLAHGIGLTVVAEGVESEAQRQLLVGHRCDQLQGYLVSQPRPEQDIAKLAGLQPAEGLTPPRLSGRMKSVE